MVDRRGSDGEGDAGSLDDRAAEGLAHLQAAARELIAAARAVLDVAEDLVDDPKVVSAALENVGAVVRDVVTSGLATRPGGGDRDDDGGLEHIRIS